MKRPHAVYNKITKNEKFLGFAKLQVNELPESWLDARYDKNVYLKTIGELISVSINTSPNNEVLEGKSLYKRLMLIYDQD